MEKIFDRFLPIKRDDGQVLRGIRQYETAPVVRLHLIGEDGEGVDIGGCDAVSLTLARPDGAAVARTLSVNSVICMAPAVIEVAFADGVYTAVSGLCELALDVYSGGLRMTSARMRYIVEPAIEVSDGDVEVDAGYSMFLEAMSDLSVLYGEVKTSEGLRVTAESERVAAESERSDSEALRVKAESMRADAEKARISGEATRGSAEAARVSAETERASAEGLRVSAETVRARAEVGRMDAESARVSAETERASAEGLRTSAENARADAESARVSAEGLRVSAEAKRVSAEVERVNAENAREKEIRGLIEDVVAATGCKVFDIDMWQYGIGDLEVGETYYLDSGISVPNVRLGDFAFDTVAGYIYKCVRKAEADAIVGDGFLCVAALGGSSGGGGGFRKIGFTSDCDYIATAEDGLTAFRDALDAASDGETFYVMPGTYVSTETLTISKNLNFIGIGMPIIKFPIYIYGEGEYKHDTGIISVLVPIVTYSTNWSGIHFTNTVRGFWTQAYSSPLAYSAINSENCIFEGLRNVFVGNHFRSRLIFECAEVHDYVSLGSSFEPAVGCVFESCDLIFRNPFRGFIKAENCDIFFETSGSTYAQCSYIFENCNIYNCGGIILTNGQYVYTFVVKNCNIFGAKFFSEATESDNHLFVGTAMQGEGAMVFKGVVDALPENANEGEVYKHMIAEEVGGFNGCYSFFTIYANEIEGYAFAEEMMAAIASVLDNANNAAKPITFNIEATTISGDVSNYTIEATTYSIDTDNVNGPVYIIHGETSAGGTVYFEAGENIRVTRSIGFKTVVWNNGEWVEL